MKLYHKILGFLCSKFSDAMIRLAQDIMCQTANHKIPSTNLRLYVCNLFRSYSRLLSFVHYKDTKHLDSSIIIKDEVIISRKYTDKIVEIIDKE